MKRRKHIITVLLGLGITGTIGIYLNGFYPFGKSKVKNPRPVPAFEIPAKQPGTPYVYFIAIGDQGTGDARQKLVARLMSAKAARDSLHFVITLGDNIYPDGAFSADDPQWREKFEHIYNLPFLNVPFYASLGNHDHHKNNAIHAIEYSKVNPKWVLPDFYYAFTKSIDSEHDILFIALDTEPIVEKQKSANEQIAWLEKQLKSSGATWKIVFGHHPVFSFGKHGHEKEMIKRVRPLLEKYRVDAYFAGHDHDRQLFEPVNGVHYIISGTGAKSRDTWYGPKTIFAATNPGFVWSRVSPSQFHVQFINEKGEIEFAYTWEKGNVPLQAYVPQEWKMKKEKKKDKKKKKKKKRKKKKKSEEQLLE